MTSRPRSELEPAQRRLAFDPTPAGLVGDKSLRKAFKSEWARVRSRHFKETGLLCALCGATESERRLIHGHEVYSFPSPTVVRLDRILFICTRCHDTIHLQRSRLRCGPDYVQALEAHYRMVNGGLSDNELDADFSDMLRQSAAIRKLYSGEKAKPELDFGPYRAGVEAARKRKRITLADDDDDDGDFELYPDHECPWDVGHG